MFRDCNSLTNLNLSNFNTQNVTDMEHMFSFCNSLTNLITKDNKILEEFKNKIIKYIKKTNGCPKKQSNERI